MRLQAKDSGALGQMASQGGVMGKGALVLNHSSKVPFLCKVAVLTDA